MKYQPNWLMVSRQVWEFAEAYQRWQMIAELRESHEKPEPVHHISWAPNVGRCESFAVSLRVLHLEALQALQSSLLLQAI